MCSTADLHERVWSLIDKLSDDECWIWKGSQSNNCRIMVNWKRHNAHNVVWEESHGNIPDSCNVIRTCQNKNCCNPKHLTLSPTWHERFWSHVDKTSIGGCWEWTGRNYRNTGYGAFSLNRKLQYAHRLSYVMAHGDIPVVDGKTLYVCHHCDNKKCVNPDHLFVGTHSDNTQDCVKKGRNGFLVGRGESNGRCKLTDVQADEIRANNGRLSQRALASMYGVTQSHIWRIRHGVCRVHGTSWVSRINGKVTIT